MQYYKLGHMINYRILVFFISITFQCMLIGGCSTIATQLSPTQQVAKEVFGDEEIPLIYGGVRMDAKMVKDISKGGSGQAGGIGAMYVLIDFPLSLVADTLLLPYSIYRTCNENTQLPSN